MEPVADWLGDADKIADLGCRLRESGVPIERLALYRRTLHPELLGRATLWAPGRPVEIFDRQHGLDLSPGFAKSPLDLAMTEGAEQVLTRQQIIRRGWRWAEPLLEGALAELRLRPLSSMAVLAVATSREGGLLSRDLSLLCRLAEGFAGKSSRSRHLR